MLYQNYGLDEGIHHRGFLTSQAIETLIHNPIHEILLPIRIALDIVWQVIEHNIPELLSLIAPLLPREKQ